MSPDSRKSNHAWSGTLKSPGDDLRQPKVENLGVAALGRKDVGRFDVAMDDAFRVRRIQRIGDLDGQRQSQLGFSMVGQFSKRVVAA